MQGSSQIYGIWVSPEPEALLLVADPAHARRHHDPNEPRHLDRPEAVRLDDVSAVATVVGVELEEIPAFSSNYPLLT